MIPLLTRNLISKSFRQRLDWIKAIFVCVVLIVVLRAIHLQFFQRSSLEELSQRQYDRIVPIKTRRGSIYSSDGTLLAVSLPMDSFFAVPSKVKSPNIVAKRLSPILKISKNHLLKKLTAKVNFVWLSRNVKPETASAIKSMRQDGIHSLKEYQRFYPQGRHAAQLLGFSGIDSRGLEGLEYQFDSHLMNNSAMPSSWRRLFSGSAVDNLSGGSLILTLNHKLQYFTEKELRKAVSVMRAKHGLAIVMESQTGNILALANMPDFDPNNFGRYNPNTYLNRSVSAWYEPGSTFKIITVASALESGAIEKEDIFNCEEGEYQIQDRVIHDVAKFGWLPLKKVIQYSSNICAAKIGQRLSRPVFYRMIHEFGFGKKTGIALPGEINGKVHDYQSWSDTDVATISYGHSITATPLQVLRAINVIATSGLLIKPRIVQKILSPQGIPISLGQHRGGKRILSENVSKIMKEFMISVIQPGGTGYLAKINGVSVAGKTGTSKKFDHKRQEYSSTNHIVSFVGFFPSDRPKLTILVTIDEPQQKYLRSKGAAPVFKKIAEHAIKYHQPESFINKSDRPPDSTVFSPVAFNPLTFQDKGTFSYKVMSLLKGKTLREVIQISDINAIKIRINGSGRVFRVTKSGFPDTIYTVELR